MAKSKFERDKPHITLARSATSTMQERVADGSNHEVCGEIRRINQIDAAAEDVVAISTRASRSGRQPPLCACRLPATPTTST